MDKVKLVTLFLFTYEATSSNTTLHADLTDYEFKSEQLQDLFLLTFEENSFHTPLDAHMTWDKFPNQLLQDLTSNSDSERNFIFVSIGLNLQCYLNHCEKYTALELRKTLEVRGKLLRPNSEIISYPQHNNTVLKEQQIFNAGSSPRDVFLIHYDSNILQIFNDIRKYNGESYIIVFIGNNKEFKLLQNLILLENVLNIYIIRPSETDEETYIMYEVCAFCKNVRHHIMYYNSWSPQTGFKSRLQYSPSFKGSFHGSPLRIGVKANNPPFIFITSVTNDGQLVTGGQEYWLMQYLSSFLDFKYVYVSIEYDFLYAKY